MQSRLMSLIEATANVAIGFGVAVLAQIVVFPLFGLDVPFTDNLLIGASVHRRVRAALVYDAPLVRGLARPPRTIRAYPPFRS